MARWRGGAVARWRGGAVARWRGGAVARWRGGAVARWRGGAVARWRGGAVARWRGGAVARWRGGAVARWRGGAVARWRGGAVARWRGGAVAARWRNIGFAVAPVHHNAKIWDSNGCVRCSMFRANNHTEDAINHSYTNSNISAVAMATICILFLEIFGTVSTIFV